MKDNIQLIIPMSGIGKRFIEAGYKDPKPLIEVDGHPIIKHVVDLFPGVTDITFICNEPHLRETNMRSVLESIVPNCKIYSIPNHKKGPVYTVSQIFDHIDDSKETIITYCDYGTVWNFDKFLEEIHIGNFDGSIPCYTGFHPHMLGSDNYAFCKEENKVLLQIKEKEPFTNNKMNEYASNGTYYFKSGNLVKKYFKQLLESGNDLKGEFYISLVYNLLVKDGLRTNIFEIDKMLQWGTPYDLEIYKSWSSYFKKLKTNKLEIINQPNTTLVLPMAGRGSRFSMEGFKLPKPLIDVDGLPMVVQAVDCLPSCDNNTFVCLKEHVDEFKLDTTLKQHYKNTSVLSIDKTTEGQACTCELAINHFNIELENPILISACDNGVYYDSNEYQRLIDDPTVDVIVWSFRNNQTSKVNPNMYSWLDVDENNNIKHVSCKKFIYDNPLQTHAIIGTMFFRKAKYFIDGLKENYDSNIRTNGEFYVDDVINQNIKHGLNVKVFEVEHYICWGTPSDYKTYNYWKEYFIK
jgi:bifunctional N-acetylglucosamine-1-phosphate-uridyltransferase/glucosamine-1-phosphate-acetyltransferase GlmU-like protein